MLHYKYSSTSKIRVASREFDSIEELIKSGHTTEFERKMTGNHYVFWWKNLTVRFPDKGMSSTAFVECINQRVTVGYPAYYLWYDFPTIKEALQFADRINKAWLEFEGEWKIFLREKLPKLEKLNETDTDDD